VSRLHQHTISVKHALDGVIYTFKTQPNFQIHSIFASLAIAASLFFRVSAAEWAVILFTIGLVLVAEMINTSIESVVDLATDQFHEKAKIAKDVSAGMVLVTAVISFLVGILIFVPYIINLLYRTQ